MVKLGLANSRMKDFYDVWTMVNQFQIIPEKIAPVIRDVFQNRKTIVQEVPKAFSEAFYNTPKTLKRWDSFLKSIANDPISLEKVVLEIKDFFLPLLLNSNKETIVSP